jgi:D-3-phosphoglycerate dehydrogenase
VAVRYYGEALGKTDLIVSAVLVGLFKQILSTGVSAVNAKAVAQERGIEVVESQSTRARDYTRLLSVKVKTSAGEHWVEGAVFDKAAPRLVLIDGVPVEAVLEGSMIVLSNTDQPGVIGEVGTVLGKKGINIGTFALGRDGKQAVGVVSIDETKPVEESLLAELRALPAVKTARLVRV